MPRESISVSATLNTKGEWVVHVGGGSNNGGGSSGGGRMIVNVTDVDFDNYIANADKTGAEIVAALEAGVDVVAHMPSEMHGAPATCVLHIDTYGKDEDGSCAAIFTGYTRDDNPIELIGYYIIALSVISYPDGGGEVQFWKFKAFANEAGFGT